MVGGTGAGALALLTYNVTRNSLHSRRHMDRRYLRFRRNRGRNLALSAYFRLYILILARLIAFISLWGLHRCHRAAVRLHLRT